MRVLYHYLQSVFSRRTRLALAHKGLDVELRDGRVNEAFVTEARQLTPIRTMPVLVDEGRVVADSGAIAQYLDLAYPNCPLLWPRDAVHAQEALAITTSIDATMNVLVDMGTRYWPLRNDAAWAEVLAERMTRAQLAIDFVATKAKRATLAGDAWSIADIWTLASVRWVTSMPARASTSPAVAQILQLGHRFPDALVEWAKQHEGRDDVRKIYD
jgi:glutathione S-transferase